MKTFFARRFAQPGDSQVRLKSWVIAAIAACGTVGVEARQFQAGFDQMERGRYEAALARFERAEADDRPRALFLQGAALNRQGNFEAALQRLEAARAAGFDHLELDFEQGWTLLRLRRHREAIRYLEAYEAASPGRGQTSEFLGRAHLALGDHAKAREMLARAIERDPSLHPTAAVYLAMAEQAAGRPEAARRHWNAVLTDPVEFGPAAVMQEELDAAVRELALEPPDARPWELTLSFSGGYNSNVIAWGDAVPPPADITNLGGGFFRSELVAAYDLWRGERDRLIAAYGFQADLYGGQHSDANLIYHVGRLTYSRRLTDELAGGLNVQNAFILLGGEAFRNVVTVEPSFTRRINRHLAATAAYRCDYADYFFDTLPVRNRDGTAHTLRGSLAFQIPPTDLRGRAGYFHTWHNTKGSDFDRNTNGLFLSLQHPLPWEISGHVEYTRLFADYRYPNSFTGLTAARRDRADLVSARLTRPLRERLDVFVRYDSTRNNSNIAIFGYTQHVVSAGLTYRF